jgi:hypothetical protein
MLWLISACVVFAVLIAFEIYAGSDGNVETSKISIHVDPAPVGRQAPQDAPGKLIAVAMARPLFSPTRRPPRAAGPVAEDFTGKRLAGIVILPGYRLAIFAVNGAKPLALTEGETVNGWQIETITPRDISLRGPMGVRTLRPKMDAAREFPLQSLKPANMAARPEPGARPIPATVTRTAPRPNGVGTVLRRGATTIGRRR